MKRLSLPARMRWAQALTIAALLVTAWLVGRWLSDSMSWWLAFPLAWAEGWFLGWFTMTKVQPRIYRWIILRWIDEQPESVRYLLRLRFYFEFEEKE